MPVSLDHLWEAAKGMKDPTHKVDLVELGFILDLNYENGIATVRLAPPGDDSYIDEAKVNAVRRVLGSVEGVNTVKIERDQQAKSADTPMSVHLEVLNAETGAPQGEADEEAVDFSEWGPTELPAEGDFDIPQDRYEGKPPVFQWEIDPSDPDIERGDAELVLDDWEYSIWWQTHPAELVYASIQALSEDHETGPGRQHPIGRNVAVNLVYDIRRGGVTAIYGTARDFRPFVEAFRLAYGIKND